MVIRHKDITRKTFKECCKTNDVDMLYELLQVCDNSEYYNYGLIVASKYGCDDIIRLLVESNVVDVNYKYKYKTDLYCPLHYAVYYENVSTVKLLFELGAVVNWSMYYIIIEKEIKNLSTVDQIIKLLIENRKLSFEMERYIRVSGYGHLLPGIISNIIYHVKECWYNP